MRLPTTPTNPPGERPTGARPRAPRRPGRLTGAPAASYSLTVNDFVNSALELLPA